MSIDNRQVRSILFTFAARHPRTAAAICLGAGFVAGSYWGALFGAVL